MQAFLLVGSLSLSAATFAAAEPAKSTRNVTWEDIANDHLTTKDVLQYGMGTNAQRWSPLAQVNDKNVFKLTPAWSYSFGDEKQRGQESQAIVSDGVVYVTGSYSRVFALDAKTGKRLWTYNHRLPDNIRPCCDVVNRGAAIFGDKIYFGTLDARLIALDKNTGKVVWNKKFGDHAAGYTMTGAPVLIKDKVSGKVLLIHGSSGDEFGVVGQLFARDPDTGEEVWMRPFVEGHMGRLNGKDSTTTGDVKAPSWPDDPPPKPARSRPGATVAARLGRAQASMPRPTPSSSAPATPARGTPGRAPPRTATPTTSTASTPRDRSASTQAPAK